MANAIHYVRIPAGLIRSSEGSCSRKGCPACGYSPLIPSHGIGYTKGSDGNEFWPADGQVWCSACGKVHTIDAVARELAKAEED